MWHFQGFNAKWVAPLSIICPTCITFISKGLENIWISSTYTKTYLQFNTFNTLDIRFSKEMDKLVKPKGFRFYPQIPASIMNAAFFLHCFSNSICQNQDITSRLEKYCSVASLIASNTLSKYSKEWYNLSKRHYNVVTPFIKIFTGCT